MTRTTQTLPIETGGRLRTVRTQISRPNLL
jgi:hypothetical protein